MLQQLKNINADDKDARNLYQKLTQGSYVKF